MLKAFSLVELIVVITILTILGTAAFISLQGYKGEGEKYRYEIKYDGFYYKTKSYRNVDNCIEFTDRRDRKMTVCGNYLIIKI